MITDEEFLKVLSYMKQNYGIDLSQKKVIVNGRLENHIKSGGWKNLHDYMEAMKKDRSGELEKMLGNIGDYFDKQADYAQKKMTARLEPALLTALAVLTGFIVISIYMPLFTMYGLL